MVNELRLRMNGLKESKLESWLEQSYVGLWSPPLKFQITRISFPESQKSKTNKKLNQP